MPRSILPFFPFSHDSLLCCEGILILTVATSTYMARTKSIIIWEGGVNNNNWITTNSVRISCVCGNSTLMKNLTEARQRQFFFSPWPWTFPSLSQSKGKKRRVRHCPSSEHSQTNFNVLAFHFHHLHSHFLTLWFLQGSRAATELLLLSPSQAGRYSKQPATGR